MIEAYQTAAQALYWGYGTKLVDLGPDVSAVQIPSQLSLRQQPVLGSAFPRLSVGRVDYRVQIPRLLIGDNSDLVRANPEGTVAVIQSDSETALLMPAAVSGIPEQAQSAGEIVGNVTIQPQGQVWRCKATQASGGNVTVGNSSQVFVVIVSGSGTVTRGSTSAGGGPRIASLGTSGNTVTVPAGTTAWVLEATKAGV